MISLSLWIIVSLVLFFGAPVVLRAALTKRAPSLVTGVSYTVRAFAVLIVVFACISTSYVYVGANKSGHLRKVYLGTSLANGKIIATNGEKGPQSDVLPEGFHVIPFVNVIYDVENLDMATIPEGQYGYLVAKDGQPLRPDQTYADAFDPKKSSQMFANAAFFLAEGGQKGPQTSILGPGSYRYNRYLWDVFVGKATDIPNGFVGVVKSNVHSRVDFGNLQADKPTDCAPVHPDAIDASALSVPLVPVGCIGTWAKPLLPGSYYINLKAYSVTQIDTRVQTWQYQGGYTERTINLTVDHAGQIEQEVVTKDVDQPKEAVDTAVITKIEGSDIPLELRALIQVRAENAPFVVASVGTLEDVENDILSPIIRAEVRNVTGSTISAPTITRDEAGTVVTDKEGNAALQNLTRPVVPLDLIENRALIEDAIEARVRPEAAKAGIDFKEIRFGQAVIPPELLLASRRTILAEELTRTFEEEQKTQKARIATEQAKATADQQNSLVNAQIELQKSEQNMQARRNEGQGERDKLALIAEGQKSQALVLGEDRVVDLRKFELISGRMFDFLEGHPNVLEAALTNASKFVPESVILFNGSPSSGVGLPEAAAIASQLFGPHLNLPGGKP